MSVSLSHKEMNFQKKYSTTKKLWRNTPRRLLFPPTIMKFSGDWVAHMSISANIFPKVLMRRNKKQLEWYEKSLDFAKKAIAANPKGAMGYTREAIANDALPSSAHLGNLSISWSKQKPIARKQLPGFDRTRSLLCARTNECESVRETKNHTLAARDCWANMDNAVKNYEKAIELRPSLLCTGLIALVLTLRWMNMKSTWTFDEDRFSTERRWGWWRL